MIGIIQVGDLHLRDSSSNPVLSRASLVAQTLRPLVAQADELYLAICGDVAFSGKSVEYELAASFFGELQLALEQTSGPRLVGVVAIPGNHDCDFDGAGDLREPSIASAAASLGEINTDGKVVSELLSL